MRLSHYIFFVLIISVIGWFISCKTTRQTAPRHLNVSYLYNPNTLGPNPKIVAWHNSHETSRIYLSIKKSDILFIKDNDNFKGALRINYLLYNNRRGNIADSSNIVLFFNINEYDTIIKHFDIKTPDSVSYLLDLTVTDINRQVGRRLFFDVERNFISNRQDFLLCNPEGIPYFDTYLQEEDEFIFKHRDKKSWVWELAYSTDNFDMPPPPHSMTNIRPIAFKTDSIRRMKVYDTTRFKMTYEGFIHFHPDSSYNGGYTVYRYHNHFPETRTPFRLLQPIRYLTSSKEFEEYNLYADKKNGVDKFWLTVGGSPSRAKELIKIYYNRVSFANTYFTSYKEGWKTDRGMLYIVMGLPSVIYKTHNIERWIYGSSQTNTTLTFNFTKRDNPLCNNDLVLNRSDRHKLSWIQAIDTWRNGRVYSVGY